MFFLAETYSNCSSDICFQVWLFDDPVVVAFFTFINVAVGLKVLLKLLGVVSDIIPF